MSFKIDKIGIALAAYKPNNDFFLEQLKSIQNQTYKNWVCIVSFDSDPSEFVSNDKFKLIWKDLRFVIKTNPSQLGAKLNFQNAIQEALKHSVDAFACSDQDDIWFADKLELSRLELLKHGPLSLVHSDMTVMVEENGKWIDKSSSAWALERRGIHNTNPQDFLIRNVVAGAAMLADAELAKKYPQIPDAFPFHDHWYAMVAAGHGGVYPISKPLYRYRQHGHNVLGVSSYKGLLSTKDKPWMLSAIARKLAYKYSWSCDLAKACIEKGLIENQALSYINQGVLKYFRQTIIHLADDPALARATAARGLGRFIMCLYSKELK